MSAIDRIKPVFTDSLLRILRLNSIFVLGIAALFRFSYFKEEDTGFGFILNTFMFIMYLVLFGLVEFKHRVFVKYFDFLTSNHGKGVFIFFCTFVMMEQTSALEVIFAIALIVVSAILIVMGCLNDKSTTEAFDYLDTNRRASDVAKGGEFTDKHGNAKTSGPPTKPNFSTSDVQAVYDALSNYMA